VSRQKGKGAKRKRSWHRRGIGPDLAFADAIKRLTHAQGNVPKHLNEDRYAEAYRELHKPVRADEDVAS